MIGGGRSRPRRFRNFMRSRSWRARLSRPDRFGFLLDLDAETGIHRPDDGDLLTTDDIAGQLAPNREFTMRDGDWTREPRRLRLPKFPEPMPEESAVIGNVRFGTFNLEALIALAAGLAIFVLDAVVAGNNRYGFAEPFAKLFVKFARSSEAAATWS